MVTTEGSPRSTCLNGFKIVDPLVMDAKNNQTLIKDEKSRVFQGFNPLCVSLVALRQVVDNKFSKIYGKFQHQFFL